MSVLEFAYLWDGSEAGWVLVRLDGAEGAVPYAIVNRTTMRGLIIEDEATCAEVVGRMLDRGCPVVMPSDLQPI